MIGGCAWSKEGRWVRQSGFLGYWINKFCVDPGSLDERLGPCWVAMHAMTRYLRELLPLTCMKDESSFQYGDGKDHVSACMGQAHCRSMPTTPLKKPTPGHIPTLQQCDSILTFNMHREAESCQAANPVPRSMAKFSSSSQQGNFTKPKVLMS